VVIVDNAEGLQQWKAMLLDHLGHQEIVVDLGSGITYPYYDMLDELLTPRCITFVDNRFEKGATASLGDNKFLNFSREDAFTFLKDYEDHAIDFLWASEFFEHIPPSEQIELLEIIRRVAKKYTLTFPTTKHHDFHKDWTHRPVLIPHHSFLLYGDTAWEGMITNDQETINKVKERYPYVYDFYPRKIVSKDRLAKLGEEAYD